MKYQFAFIGLFTFGKLLSQCDMGVSMQVSVECYEFQSVFVSINGGTPPYVVSLAWSGGDGGSMQTEGHTSPYWSLYADLGPGGEATVTITDAMGCIATHNAGYLGTAVFLPNITTTNTVEGTILRWNGTFQYGPGGCTAPPYVYNITPELYGYVAEDWIPEGNGVWRYPDPLPTGSNHIMIYPEAGPHINCGSQIECYGARIVQITGTVQLRMKAVLGGLGLNEGLMSDHLRSQDLVPLSEPYGTLGYQYIGAPGGMNITAQMLATTGVNAIVDWVVLEIRSSQSPSDLLYSQPALLRRNRELIGTNGNTLLDIPLPPGYYHVALRHRNHLGVMTETPVALTGTALMIDFSSPSTSTWGTGARKALNNIMMLWPGDANFNGQVKYTGVGNDRDVVLQAVGGTTPSNVVNGIYSGADINMDGEIKYTGINNDRDIILQTIGGVVPTAVKVAQVP